MSARRILLLALIPLGAGLAACSAGNSGDEAVSSIAGVPTGIERFLLFPNPIVTASSFETDTDAYAQAYYNAVDPGNARSTLQGFKNINGFGGGGGEDYTVVFRDVRDLGYGRRMSGRYVPGSGGSPTVPERVAFFVENYFVDVPGGGYNRINVDAAVVRDTKWHIGTNAIEWSCHPDDAALNPDTCVRYAKYFTYAPNGQRQLRVDMDGRGAKAMPGPCISCHGGRADPLEADGSFPKVANTLLDRSGDVQGRLHMFPVDTFEWSATPGFTRPDQEATLRKFNEWVLCTYPTPTGSGNETESNNCLRTPAGANEWQGTAASIIEAAYGGTLLPNGQFNDTAVPNDWSGEVALYEQVVRPYCRTCHIVRGTANQSDIDFASAAKFEDYADRIKVHVFDRGNMPLALIVYQDFWRSSAPSTLATYIDSLGKALPPGGTLRATNPGGAPLQPGRPIADAGPAFRIAPVATETPLSAADSLFANAYAWAVISAPMSGDGMITNPSSSTASFRATTPGSYEVQLTVSAGGQSDSTTIRLIVPNLAAIPDAAAYTFDPAAIKFAQIADIVQNNPDGGQACTDSGCHGPSGKAPIQYDETDLVALLPRLRGRVNLTERVASPLLRKPIGKHHNVSTMPIDLDPLEAGSPPDPFAPANTALRAQLLSFSKLYYWIANGLPAGGVVASAKDTRPNPNAAVAFTTVPGPEPTFSVLLRGEDSINEASYTWSIVDQPDSVNFPASLSSTTAANPTLTVRYPAAASDPRPHVVRLVVNDGTGTTDVVELTVPVVEENLTASFVPSGDVEFPFPSLPSNAAVNLTPTINGTAFTCAWSVVPGPGAPGGVSFGSPSACGVTSFTVPSAAIGLYYDVTFTANSVSRQAVATNRITVRPPAGSNPSNANFTFGTPTLGFTIGGNLANAGSPAVVMGNNLLTGSANGLAPLTFSWSAGPAGVNPASGCAISGSPAQQVSLTATSVGNCSVTLTVSNGILPNAVRTLTVPVTSLRTLTHVADVFTDAGCTAGGCHAAGSATATMPNWEKGDGGPAALAALRARMDAADIYNATPHLSRLVVCPSAGCGAMTGNRTGFGSGGFGNYDIFLTWLRNGRP